MKTSISRLTFVVTITAMIVSFACLEAKAQSGLFRSLFDGGVYNSEAEVQALYDSNAQRPLGGLFAPGFTRTFTILGGLNFPSASVTDPDSTSGQNGIAAAISSAIDDDFFSLLSNERSVDGTGYAISFAFGRRHNRRLRSEIEVAFRDNNINNTSSLNGLVNTFNGGPINTGTEVDGSINATSLMKNYIFPRWRRCFHLSGDRRHRDTIVCRRRLRR